MNRMNLAMKTKVILLLLTIMCVNISALAQDMPTISPLVTYLNADGEEQQGTNVSESAPLEATFTSCTENADGWNAHYEWRFYKDGKRESPYLIRYDETTTYTFTEAGAHYVELYATFTQGNDTVCYTDEYWTSEGSPITITISESKLEMPNAFSPNGDGINDIYKAKEGYQSIVEFHAYIFNRWGQKLYDWDDPAGGWDGKYKGKDVAQGVYYCLVKAKGADGRNYSIKKDINLLRGYTEETTTNE